MEFFLSGYLWARVISSPSIWYFPKSQACKISGVGQKETGGMERYRKALGGNGGHGHGHTIAWTVFVGHAMHCNQIWRETNFSGNSFQFNTASVRCMWYHDRTKPRRGIPVVLFVHCSMQSLMFQPSQSGSHHPTQSRTPNLVITPLNKALVQPISPSMTKIVTVSRGRNTSISSAQTPFLSSLVSSSSVSCSTAWQDPWTSSSQLPSASVVPHNVCQK